MLPFWLVVPAARRQRILLAMSPGQSGRYSISEYELQDLPQLDTLHHNHQGDFYDNHLLAGTN